MGFFEFPHTRTYDSDLGWLIKHVGSYDEVIQTLNDWIAQNEPKLDDFENLYNMMMAGDLPPGVQEGINKWMQLHALDIVGQLVKMVYFGIDDSGYFKAYIPDGWDDIIFNTTGYDINIAGLDYGHLTLSFDDQM